MNYFIFHVDGIQFDSQDNTLPGIILFPLLMRSDLIYRMWAFLIIHNRPLGLYGLGPHSRLVSRA